MRIIVADDQGMFRDGLRMILEGALETAEVSEVDDEESLVESSFALKPDLVVLDIHSPRLNGACAVRRIGERVPQTKVVALSTQGEKRHVAAAFRAGVKAYVLKSWCSQELILAVRAAHNNESYLSPLLSEMIISGFIGREETSRSIDLLTQREHQAFVMLTCGKSCKEIAFELKISPKTVETYRQNVMKKLKVCNVVQLANYAMREGIPVGD